MIFITVLIFILITFLALALYAVMPRFIKSEGQRLRDQVDELAEQLRTQLNRVEAQQRSMTENVVTLKSYAIDKALPGGGEWQAEDGHTRNFFNALVKELGDRVGGRFWIVESNGRLVGEAAGGPNLQSLSNLDLPMAIPLRTLLAQAGEGLRQTQFRTASGEHTLIVQTITDTPWLLAIDIPTRHMGTRTQVVLQQPWPLATLLLVSTLTLVRSLNQHLSRLHEELPSLLHHDDADIRDRSAHLPALLKEMGELIGTIASAASQIAQKNERLLLPVPANANGVAMLADTASEVVLAMNVLQQEALNIADNAGTMVQLASRAYTYALHDEEGVFAIEARNLAQRCARSSRDLRALITDAIMQAQNGSLTNGQSNHVLIEEVYTVANALLQRVKN